MTLQTLKVSSRKTTVSGCTPQYCPYSMLLCKNSRLFTVPGNKFARRFFKQCCNLQVQQVFANYRLIACSYFSHSHILIPILMHLIPIPIPMADRIPMGSMGIPWDPWDTGISHSRARLYHLVAERLSQTPTVN